MFNKKVREKTVEEHFVAQVTAHYGWAIKFLPYFINGFPDRIALFPGGHIFFVELKRPKNNGGVLRKLQIEVHQMLRALGFKVYTLYSITEVDEFINEVHTA